MSRAPGAAGHFLFLDLGADYVGVVSCQKSILTAIYANIYSGHKIELKIK